MKVYYTECLKQKNERYFHCSLAGHFCSLKFVFFKTNNFQNVKIRELDHQNNILGLGFFWNKLLVFFKFSKSIRPTFKWEQVDDCQVHRGAKILNITGSQKFFVEN